MKSPQEAKAFRFLSEAVQNEPLMEKKAERLAAWTGAGSTLLLCALFLVALGAGAKGLWWALFVILGFAAGVLGTIGSYTRQGRAQWRVLRPFLDVDAIKRADRERAP